MSIIKKVFDRIVERSISILFVVMFLCVLTQIVLRNFTTIPVPWTEELARYIYVWLVFFGATVISSDDEHIRVEMFAERIPAKLKPFINMIVQALIILFCISAIKGGITLVKFNSNKPTVTLPKFVTFSYMYFAIPFSFGIMLIISIISFIKNAMLVYKTKELTDGQ